MCEERERRVEPGLCNPGGIEISIKAAGHKRRATLPEMLFLQVKMPLPSAAPSMITDRWQPRP
jgi:hypothetical protein